MKKTLTLTFITVLFSASGAFAQTESTTKNKCETDLIEALKMNAELQKELWRVNLELQELRSGGHRASNKSEKKTEFVEALGQLRTACPEARSRKGEGCLVKTSKGLLENLNHPAAASTLSQIDRCVRAKQGANFKKSINCIRTTINNNYQIQQS